MDLFLKFCLCEQFDGLQLLEIFLILLLVGSSSESLKNVLAPLHRKVHLGTNIFFFFFGFLGHKHFYAGSLPSTWIKNIFEIKSHHLNDFYVFIFFGRRGLHAVLKKGYSSGHYLLCYFNSYVFKL